MADMAKSTRMTPNRSYGCNEVPLVALSTSLFGPRRATPTRSGAPAELGSGTRRDLPHRVRLERPIISIT